MGTSKRKKNTVFCNVKQLGWDGKLLPQGDPTGVGLYLLLSQSVSFPQTNRDLLAEVFLLLAPITFSCNSDHGSL